MTPARKALQDYLKTLSGQQPGMVHVTEPMKPVCPPLKESHDWDEDQWFVGIQSWAGLTWHRVTILKESPKRSRVRFEEPAVGRSIGHEQNVPNHALKFGKRPC